VNVLSGRERVGSRRTGGRRRVLARRVPAVAVLAPLVVLAAFSATATAASTSARASAPATATATAGTVATKGVSYRGYRLVVPAGWPVYHLTSHSTVCVRFNRHAVYLGLPSAAQRCPAHAAGRTEAILVTPLAASSARDRGTPGRVLSPLTAPGARPERGSQAQLTVAAHAVQVTATWARDRALVQRALGVKLGGGTATVATAAARRPAARSAAAPRTGSGTVYTGRGFDACSTPSPATMTAWGASPYRALGVYIGGTNMACSQPNLSPSWVQQQEAAGWHLIPTYVGLQAPSNSCGCASIVPSQAGAEGTAAATDAVTQAQAVGIGAGNPIYFDMEGYSRGGSNTSAVLAFLSAWTTQLHADGYGAGVYSSAGSGMVDLASQYGTTYAEPDDIWLANWNGSQSTSDSDVPSADWAAHQRLHQYQGAHNETYGGATINIDGDYLDGATAFGVGTQVVTPVAPAPSLRVSARSNGTIALYASWQGATGVTSWSMLGGTNSTALGALGQSPSVAAVTKIAEPSAFPYYAVQALGSGGQVLGTSAIVATRPHIALYGRSAFVPARGLVGVPVGCFTGSGCRIALTVSVGRKVIARSGHEGLSANGVLYFKLSTSDRKLLAHAPGRRLPVTVKATDVTGVTASASMTLVPFVTTGAGPALNSAQSRTLQLIGFRDFVFRRSVGGILAGCAGDAPCLVKTTITAGHATIATTGTELIGANQVGYLSFRLSPYGRTLLARAVGNQLGAQVTISDATATANGTLALSGFS
jgi:hypothetical protein